MQMDLAYFKEASVVPLKILKQTSKKKTGHSVLMSRYQKIDRQIFDQVLSSDKER